MSDTYVVIMLAGLFTFALVLLNILWRNERRDLYNRIMSKDINEYIRSIGDSNTVNKSYKTAHEKAIGKWRHKGQINTDKDDNE